MTRLIFSHGEAHTKSTYFPAPQEQGVLSVRCLNFSRLVEFQTLAGVGRVLDWKSKKFHNYCNVPNFLDTHPNLIDY